MSQNAKTVPKPRFKKKKKTQNREKKRTERNFSTTTHTQREERKDILAARRSENPAAEVTLGRMRIPKSLGYNALFCYSIEGGI